MLVALTHASDSPFRVVDEPDIYMDAQARFHGLQVGHSRCQHPSRASHLCQTAPPQLNPPPDPACRQALIEAAHEKHVQMIILTPQDVSALDGNAAKLRIIRLRAPERG